MDEQIAYDKSLKYSGLLDELLNIIANISDIENNYPNYIIDKTANDELIKTVSEKLGEGELDFNLILNYLKDITKTVDKIWEGELSSIDKIKNGENFNLLVSKQNINKYKPNSLKNVSLISNRNIKDYKSGIYLSYPFKRDNIISSDILPFTELPIKYEKKSNKICFKNSDINGVILVSSGYDFLLNEYIDFLNFKKKYPNIDFTVINASLYTKKKNSVLTDLKLNKNMKKCSKTDNAILNDFYVDVITKAKYDDVTNDKILKNGLRMKEF